jgi:hypothetical protein
MPHGPIPDKPQDYNVEVSGDADEADLTAALKARGMQIPARGGVIMLPPEGQSTPIDPPTKSFTVWVDGADSEEAATAAVEEVIAEAGAACAVIAVTPRLPTQ